MFHIIYKTTNLKDGKIYIGAHSTTNIDDGYMGSGKYLKRAIRQHGLDCVIREVLYVFSSKEEMFVKERELVTQEFITTANTYNLKVGGSGGNPGIVGAFTGKKHSEETKARIAEAAAKQSVSDKTRDRMRNNNPMKHNSEAREKMRQSLLGRKQSDSHKANVAAAFLGKRRVNNGVVSKTVSEEEAKELVASGWKYGLLRKSR